MSWLVICSVIGGTFCYVFLQWRPQELFLDQTSFGCGAAV